VSPGYLRERGTPTDQPIAFFHAFKLVRGRITAPEETCKKKLNFVQAPRPAKSEKKKGFHHKIRPLTSVASRTDLPSPLAGAREYSVGHKTGVGVGKRVFLLFL